MEPGQDAQIVIPEAVALEIDTAGVGSRFIAIAIDTSIQLIPLLLVAYGVDRMSIDDFSKLGITAFVSFVSFWVYFAAFEIAWDGQTPGKRANHLRVVSADGRAESPRQAIIRNLVRGIDLLPALYLVGVITMVITPRAQRLGDLAAGTLVLRERASGAPTPLDLHPLVGHIAPLDTASVTDDEYQLIRSFLMRRATLASSTRTELALQLVRTVAPRIPGSEAWSQGPESYLEEVTRQCDQRFTG